MARWWASLWLPVSCLRSWSAWNGTGSRFLILIFCRFRWQSKEGRYEYTADRGIFVSHRAVLDRYSFHAADGGPGLATGKNQAAAYFDWPARPGIKGGNSRPVEDLDL